MRSVVVFIVASLVCTITVAAQQNASEQQDSGLIRGWLAASSRATAGQPFWMAPLFTVTPRLVQQFRYDVGWQTQQNATTVNYGGGKGLEIVPTEHIEVLISAPPYVSHSSSQLHNGLGDMAFLFKYRMAAANERQGNYIITAFLSSTIPTGSYSNGGAHATFSPSVAAGKGWGNFDLQSTAGVTLPAGDFDILGTPAALNATLQYKILGKLWPEVEVNSTFWANGKNAGKKQVFLSPGLVAGKFHLWKRVGFAIGGGVQIAATRFHAYNHNWLFSVRFPF